MCSINLQIKDQYVFFYYTRVHNDIVLTMAILEFYTRQNVRSLFYARVSDPKIYFHLCGFFFVNTQIGFVRQFLNGYSGNHMLFLIK